MIKLECKRCKNSWNYKGANPYCACCSYCKSTVFIKKSSLEQVATVAKDEVERSHQTPQVPLKP
jgi:hypothetical protein